MADETTLPVNQLAKLLMLSDRRVQQLAKQGAVVKADNGRYDLVKSVQGYIRFLQSKSIGNAASPGLDLDYHVEKARKMKSDADLGEINVAKARGQLIDAAVAEREAQSVMLEIRSRMLMVADRVTPLVLGDTNERRVRDVVADEINEALASLANTAEIDDDDSDDEPPDDDDE